MSDPATHPTSWLEQRFGLRSTFSRMVFGSVDPKWAWLRTTGMACFVLVLVEIVTGTVLGLYYTPSTTAAYKDILAIEQSPMGHFLRGLHHWTSAALIILALVTVVRMFLGAEYKGRRDVVWLAAVFFLHFALFFQLTGHALPWDTNGAATTNVEAGIAGNVWSVGPLVKRFLLGGSSLGAATLTRWYGLHTMLLPLAMALLIGLPLLAYRFRGSAVRDDMEQYGPDHEARSLEPYYPFQMGREMLVALGLFAVLAGMSLALHTPLEKEATAENISGYKAMSEWYVLPLHAATLIPPFNSQAFEPIVTAVAPTLLVVLLFALPWIDRSPDRRPVRRRFALASGGAVIALIFGLYAYAEIVERPTGEGETLAAGRPEAAAAIKVDTALAAKGKTLYDQNGCAGCHSINGAGGKGGPDLAKAGDTHPDRQWQIDHLVKPESKVPGSTMPPFAQLKKDELAALAEYMASLR